MHYCDADGAKHVELNWAYCRLRPLGNAVHEAFADARPGAGRPKGARNKLKSLRLADGHVSILARRWTARTLHEACLLAFGTDDPNEPGNPKLRTSDNWLRLAIWKMILERAWGRAPQEVNVEFNSNVNIKYTREEIARLSLEQISQLWREQVALPAGITYEPGPPDP